MSDYVLLDLPAGARRRNFARMLRVALHANCGDRAFRHQIHRDVNLMPDAILVTDAQFDELNRECPDGWLRKMPSGITLFCDVPLVASGRTPSAHRYVDQFDARDLPLTWE